MRKRTSLSLVFLTSPDYLRVYTSLDRDGGARIAGELDVVRLQQVVPNDRYFPDVAKTPSDTCISRGVSRYTQARQCADIPKIEVKSKPLRQVKRRLQAHLVSWAGAIHDRRRTDVQRTRTFPDRHVQQGIGSLEAPKIPRSPLWGDLSACCRTVQAVAKLRWKQKVGGRRRILDQGLGKVADQVLAEQV